MEFKDEGHEQDEHGINIKGPTIDLNELKKADGLITNRAGQHIGVLVRAMSAHPIEEYQQELKLANFQSSDEADECVSAINESIELGMSLTPIIDQMYARSAGVKQNYIMKIFDTITHTTVTTNYQKGKDNANPRINSRPFS